MEAEKSSGGGLGSAIGGAVVSSAVTAIIGGAFAKADAKKQREMEQKIGLLSLDQQKWLEEHLQNVQGEIAKQQIIYQYLAVQNNNEMLNKIQSKRYTSYIVLGVGIVVLAIVILKLGKK
jgi:hypothetical protein